jgi:putative aminopeptidase FrvX
MIDYKYAEFATEKTVELLGIDSPSGYTDRAATFVRDEFEALGFDAKITTKGGVIVDLGGRDKDDGLLLEAHADTLGGMVAEIKGNGRLRLTALGGMKADNGETENVKVYTRCGKVIEGTLQLCNASVHVNGEYSSSKRTFDTTEVVLDEETMETETRTVALGERNSSQVVITSGLEEGESVLVGGGFGAAEDEFVDEEFAG